MKNDLLWIQSDVLLLHHDSVFKCETSRGLRDIDSIEETKKTTLRQTKTKAEANFNRPERKSKYDKHKKQNYKQTKLS